MLRASRSDISSVNSVIGSNYFSVIAAPCWMSQFNCAESGIDMTPQ